jgi:hypothetical protein
MWLPHFYGTIETSDGAIVLFEFSGYNVSLGDRFSYERGRSVCASITFHAQAEQYRWINAVFGLLEGRVLPMSDVETWEVRAYACINDLT